MINQIIGHFKLKKINKDFEFLFNLGCKISLQSSDDREYSFFF